MLRDSEVIDLATLGLAVESHYGAPQGTERAMTGGHTHLASAVSPDHHAERVLRPYQVLIEPC